MPVYYSLFHQSYSIFEETKNLRVTVKPFHTHSTGNKAVMFLRPRQGRACHTLCARWPWELCSEQAVWPRGTACREGYHWNSHSVKRDNSYVYLWVLSSVFSPYLYIQRIFRERNVHRTMHTITVIYEPPLTKVGLAQLTPTVLHPEEGRGLILTCRGRTGWLLDHGKALLPACPRLPPAPTQRSRHPLEGPGLLTSPAGVSLSAPALDYVFLQNGARGSEFWVPRGWVQGN